MVTRLFAALCLLTALAAAAHADPLVDTFSRHLSGTLGGSPLTPASGTCTEDAAVFHARCSEGSMLPSVTK